MTTMAKVIEGWIESLPPGTDFFPPTPSAFALIFAAQRFWMPLSLVQWLQDDNNTPMGKTSVTSWLNLPGRYAWVCGELVGPLNMLYIMYTLPAKLKPVPNSPTSFLGTGLDAQYEVMFSLYLLHYLNRAVVTPLFVAPSMSPIIAYVMVFMALFQFLNSSTLACWIIYGSVGNKPEPLTSPYALAGLSIFFLGLYGNISSEWTLFDLRRAAAKRKAKSEGKATVTYAKVYVIPPVEGWFKYVLYPHYALEWFEWSGYWILGGAIGLGWGWNSGALLFFINEIALMLPRSTSGVDWYVRKFGKKAVAGRKSAIPGVI